MNDEQTPDPRIVVWMGNTDAKAGHRLADGELVVTHKTGERVMTVGFHRGTSVMEALRMVCDARGVWAAQSWAPPAWVESTNEGLALVLADHYGCPIGRPQGWGELNAD